MDKNKLYSDLVELNMYALYDFLYPLNYNEDITFETLEKRKEKAKFLYFNNTIFYQRINTLVLATLNVIEQNLTFEERK